MTLDKKRLDDCLVIFFQFFPIDVKYKIYDIPLAEILPLLKQDMLKMMTENDEQAQAIVWWISAAYHYIIGDTDEMPPYQTETDDAIKKFYED